MRFGSLFAGIGGMDLGLERAGMECVWQVEADDYCRRVLTKHWPDVPKYGDIRELDVDSLERVDLVAGGFPCQPVSIAGRRKAQEDERWLWPEFARVLRSLRPRYALLENVPGLLTAGFDDVLADLAAFGYNTDWDCVPAAAVGAPHLRWRVFVVAHAESEPVGTGLRPDEPGRFGRGRLGDGGGEVAHAGSEPRRLSSRTAVSSVGVRTVPVGAKEPGRCGGALDDTRSGRHGAPTRVVFAGGNGPEHSGWWSVEPDVGRVAHGVPSRVDRLRALGNAVVPQVAEHVGRLLVEFDKAAA